MYNFLHKYVVFFFCFPVQLASGDDVHTDIASTGIQSVTHAPRALLSVRDSRYLSGIAVVSHSAYSTAVAGRIPRVPQLLGRVLIQSVSGPRVQQLPERSRHLHKFRVDVLLWFASISIRRVQIEPAVCIQTDLHSESDLTSADGWVASARSPDKERKYGRR